MAAAALVMGLALAAAAWGLQDPLGGANAARIAALAALVLGGLVLYAGAAHVLGAARLGELKAAMRRGSPPATQG